MTEDVTSTVKVFFVSMIPFAICYLMCLIAAL